MNKQMPSAVVASHVFDGAVVHRDAAIMVILAMIRQIGLERGQFGEIGRANVLRLTVVAELDMRFSGNECSGAEQKKTYGAE